jgi:transposase
VRSARLWARLLGVEQAVVERVCLDEDEQALVVSVRPRKGARRRCGRCGRRCPGFDQGQGRRRWRALDLGVVRADLEAEAPRVCCPERGVVVAAVPWARHGAGHPRAFDDTAAWLAVHTSKQAVGERLRVAWRRSGASSPVLSPTPRRAWTAWPDCGAIGIDEISYKRGHRYLTVVVDHDAGRLVWAAPATTRPRLAAASMPSARSAASSCGWSAPTRPPGSRPWWPSAAPRRGSAWTRSMSPEWATDALDQVRREVWNTARQGGQTALARELKGARYALGKHPGDLTARQRAKLAWIARVNDRLDRADLVKEELRLVVTLKGVRATVLLQAWLAWARRCRIPAFVELATAIARHRADLQATLTQGLSGGPLEAVNTKIRLLTRVAFGFKSPEALIALAMLSLGGLCPSLPGRG